MARSFLLAPVLVVLMGAGAFANEDITPRAVTAGATLTITGPDTAKQGEDAFLKIGGLTLDEIKQAKQDKLFDLTVYPLDKVRVHASYDWLNDSLELMFRAGKPGTYLVKMHLVRDGKLEIATTEIIVEGDVEPEPGPDPPEPSPKGEKQLLFVAESSTTPSLPRSQQAILASLTLRQDIAKAGHVILGFSDPDSLAAGGKYPEWAAVAKGKELPVLLMAPKNGGSIVSHPLPADEAALWNLIGGKP